MVHPIPPEIFCYIERFEFVIVDDGNKAIELFELKCCGDTDGFFKGEDNPFSCKLSVEVCALETFRVKLVRSISYDTLLASTRLDRESKPPLYFYASN